MAVFGTVGAFEETFHLPTAGNTGRTDILVEAIDPMCWAAWYAMLH